MGFRREGEVQSSVIARPHPDLAEASSNAVAAGDGQQPLPPEPALASGWGSLRLACPRLISIACRRVASLRSARALSRLRRLCIEASDTSESILLSSSARWSARLLTLAKSGRFRSAPRLVSLGSSFDATVAVKVVSCAAPARDIDPATPSPRTETASAATPWRSQLLLSSLISSITARRARVLSDDEPGTPNLLVRRQVPRVLPLPQYKSYRLLLEARVSNGGRRRNNNGFVTGCKPIRASWTRVFRDVMYIS